MIRDGVDLGLAELRRTWRRLWTSAAALTVLVLLTLTLAGLADALERDSTGVLRSLDADLVVFNEEARQQLLRSRVPAPLGGSLVFVDGVRQTGTIGLLPSSLSSGDVRYRITVVGYTARTPAEPRNVVEGRVPLDGEPGIVAADVRLRDRGLSLGDTVTLAGDRQVEIVGFVEGAMFLQQPTVWVPHDLWARVRASAFPEAGWSETLVGATVVQLNSGADRAEVAAAIEDQLADLDQDVLDLLDVEDDVDGIAVNVVPMAVAVDAIPGVDVQRSTFSVIVALAVAVVGMVMGLLFTLLVAERRPVLATLRAVGASPRVLVVMLLTQVLVLWAIATAGGTLATLALAQVVPDAMPLALRPSVVATVAAALLVASAAGAAVALRRVMRLEPATVMQKDVG